nr:MAG: hypothetical protein [Bacteriophage sp.]
MKGTIVTGSLIVFSDGFVWKRLSNEKAYKIWVSAENEDFELYKVRVDDESESLIESLEGWGEDDYAFYGLPLFKATAVKYGWDNPIGEDSGRERKYDSQY